MEVVAAIPVGSHKNEQRPRDYVCVVHYANWPSGEPRFAAVWAYLSPDGTGWRTNDEPSENESSQTGAVTEMIRRAGHERPVGTVEADN
jgi:hypothetical protein